MALKTYAQLIEQIDEIREEEEIGGNTRQRIAQMFEDILDSCLVYGGEWSHATEFPTSPKEGIYYVRVGDFGVVGDATYIPSGAWIVSKIDGADSIDGYTIKL